MGTDHDTSSFAVESIRRWWNMIGRQAYPQARQLLITADGGGFAEELLADRRTVRTSHTAMQHTASGDTTFERPPGGRALQSIAEVDSMILTQWTTQDGPRLLFALHDTNGALLAAAVNVAIKGDLIGATEEGLLFLNTAPRNENYITGIQGRLRWSRQKPPKTENPRKPSGLLRGFSDLGSHMSEGSRSTWTAASTLTRPER